MNIKNPHTIGKSISKGRISRKEAIENGADLYWTGKPCPKGHLTFRYVKNGSCQSCARDRNKHAYHGVQTDEKAVSARRRIEDREMKVDDYDFDL